MTQAIGTISTSVGDDPYGNFAYFVLSLAVFALRTAGWERDTEARCGQSLASSILPLESRPGIASDVRRADQEVALAATDFPFAKECRDDVCPTNPNDMRGRG
jgi:hypothetical protein